MKPEQLKEALLLAGWRFGLQPFRTASVDWYAWMPRELRETVSHCVCNDRPPSFCLEPFSIELDGVTHSSVTFRLCGELPNGQWVDLRAYSVQMEDAMKTISPAKAVLFAAWEAAYAAAITATANINTKG